jgi:FtsP/CotA-like multicopper oxidase with cupredoxin domain
VIKLSRRSFLNGLAGTTAAAALVSVPNVPALGAVSKVTSIIAKPGTTGLFGADGNMTDVWAYGGEVPGPVLRVKQGETLKVDLQNELPQKTTIHWHGLRIKNEMDGVPFLTQKPVGIGQRFTYDFNIQDAGTYWYHPHVNTSEQVGRGLHGALIVEEQDPVQVDREVVWVLDDWRIQKDGAIAPFGGLHDAAHAGRYGNVVTINGKTGTPFKVRSGERIRLRLINAANARIFGLEFEGHEPWRIAIDGHPVTPAKTGTGPIVIAPGGRIDLVIDMTAKAGETFKIRDRYHNRFAYTLALIAYSDQKPIRSKPLEAPKKMAANPVPFPQLGSAERHEMIFQGGAMGGLRGATYKGKEMGLRELARMGMVWAVNGEVIPPIEEDDIGKPMVSLKKGSSHILRWRNDTAFAHPIHMHGHSFHLISRNGTKLFAPLIMDTVLIAPKEYVDVAFVADNPGDWALHCHILEHAKSGMMGFVRVG